MSYLSQSQRSDRRAAARRRVRRRRTATAAVVLVLVAAVAALALGGGSGTHARATNGGSAAATGASASTSTSATGPRGHDPAPKLPPITAARPGVARAFFQGPSRREIALTFDDGFCAPCVARIIHTLEKTGAHATIFPNGTYSTSWVPQAAIIRRLVAKGQLQVGNHTFLHHDALLESRDAFQTDLARDEAWIEKTFGVTARPFFRPPYGAYNASTLAVAGQSGYTKVINWSGTVADSSPRTIPYILAAIRYWARPGRIILMHGNYPATSLALPQILAILKSEGLTPVTVKQLLG